MENVPPDAMGYYSMEEYGKHDDTGNENRLRKDEEDREGRNMHQRGIRI